MHTYIHTYIHTHTYIHIHTHIHTYTLDTDSKVRDKFISRHHKRRRHKQQQTEKKEAVESVPLWMKKAWSEQDNNK